MSLLSQDSAKYSPQAKSSQPIFVKPWDTKWFVHLKCLKKIKRWIIFCGTWKLHETQILVPVNKVFWHTLHSFIYILSHGSFCTTKVELSSCPQSQKHLHLSGPSEKTFANLWTRELPYSGSGWGIMAPWEAWLKVWKQPKCPSKDEWIKKLWYVYAMEYYSARKKNGILLFARAWMDLETVIQSEVSQKEKNKYRILTHICGT